MQESELKKVALENKRQLEEEFKKRTYLKLYTEILEHFLDSNENEQEKNMEVLKNLQEKMA